MFCRRGTERKGSGVVLEVADDVDVGDVVPEGKCIWVFLRAHVCLLLLFFSELYRWLLRCIYHFDPLFTATAAHRHKQTLTEKEREKGTVRGF